MRLLKFSAAWCGPCKSLSAIMDGMTLPMEVEHIDIDTAGDRAQQYKVRSVPTLIVVNDEGDPIKRASGVMSAEQLQTFLEV